MCKLQELSVGDVAVIDTGHSLRKTKIAKVTDTEYFTECGSVYNRNNGNSSNHGIWDMSKLKVLTDELEEKIKLQELNQRKYNVIQMLSEIVYGNVSETNLTKLENLIAEIRNAK